MPSYADSAAAQVVQPPCVVFLDSEISANGRVLDLGATASDGSKFHTNNVTALDFYVEKADYLCGHNFIEFDLPYLLPSLPSATGKPVIDTLALSALLFPRKRFHHLIKDEKILSEHVNNPLNDAIKTRELFEAELAAFRALPREISALFAALLSNHKLFAGFFQYTGTLPLTSNVASFIRNAFDGRICTHADIESMVRQYPVELAFVLAFIRDADETDTIAPWVAKQFPHTQSVIAALHYTRCRAGCAYCGSRLDVRAALQEYFGFKDFRTYQGEPLQQSAAQAAVDGESLLAVFPTGGGKSLTFQLPALMEGALTRALTVVISPLQALMKDQVDNLSARGIGRAVALNGLLSPIERARAFEDIFEGRADLVYVAPEMLRSRTFLSAIQSRRVTRFVVDEAHCFSVWGHDFRVDYLYIAEFIKKLQAYYNDGRTIKVSCFTATAKQKVIQDICDYFRDNLGLSLKLFTTTTERRNLTYRVIHVEDDRDRYARLRELLEETQSPAIVYVGRVSRTREVAEQLVKDGFDAVPFAGPMDPEEKTANQEQFLSGAVRIIVATNAFGMGVDKPDVGLVVHYDISSSLENYVQEAGRAGRDPEFSAKCCILFNESDLDDNFALLRNSKLSIADIQLVWNAVKSMKAHKFNISALELARKAGLDGEGPQLESKIKNAIAALELAGYIKRGMNAPRVYATSIVVDTAIEAIDIINASPLFADDEERTGAVRIVRSLISNRATHQNRGEKPETRLDYLSDMLGIPMERVVALIGKLRQAGVLANDNDMSANRRKLVVKSSAMLELFSSIEEELIARLSATGQTEFNIKEFNSAMLAKGRKNSDVRHITTLLMYLRSVKIIDELQRSRQSQSVFIKTAKNAAELKRLRQQRASLCAFILEEFASMQAVPEQDGSETVHFSSVTLHKNYLERPFADTSTTLHDVENALLYLHKTGVLQLKGGFMVLYAAMTIERTELDNKRRYRKRDYSLFSEYYRQKVQQVHIVGRYANLMLEDYDKALAYVRDYFELEYTAFVTKYFDKGENLNLNMTAKQYRLIFGELSEVQRAIVADKSQFIVVAAGPGSGKTRVLVHKLASLLTCEDASSEQLMMLTFSRQAATEFKRRLIELLGAPAYWVDIKTFHSFAFDLLGLYGSIEESEDIVKRAVTAINKGLVEPSRLMKTVLVIDEAQDMDADEFALVEALIAKNDTMRVIAVGDDDQNIYAFRGSDSAFMGKLKSKYDAVFYEMTENFRSTIPIVAFANEFAETLKGRLKSRPLVAVKNSSGAVRLINHTKPGFSQAVAAEIAKAPPQGRTAVLTSTNDEAMQVCTLLNKAGLDAELIQSEQKVTLYNLVEVRSLLVTLSKAAANDNNRISAQTLKEALERLQSVYRGSPWVENVKRLIDRFLSVEKPGARFYLSDFEEFVRESALEDTARGSRITVSTIHKAKGSEFDHVWIIINGLRNFGSPEEKRKLYVGFTRARESLTVHFDTTAAPLKILGGPMTEIDETAYPEPDEVRLPLGHEDVWLDRFEGKKAEIFKLRCGTALKFVENGLAAATPDGLKRVLYYSKAAKAKLSSLAAKGYMPAHAEINFIVAWHRVREEEEHAVVLPAITLVKCAQPQTSSG